MKPCGEETAARRYAHRFFHLDLVDFDPEELVFEVIVARELVPVLHVFAFGDLVEDARFPASQRLQSPAQFAVLCGAKRTHKAGFGVSDDPCFSTEAPPTETPM